MHHLLLAALLAADPSPPPAGFQLELHPLLQVAGGLEGELPWAATYRVPRLTTLMVSRFGLRAGLADWIEAESELEANAGLHGASAWEGQAALSVRNQLVRFHGARWKLEVGRVTDEASVDYFSQHVADFLVTDPFTRDPFLYTGYNRGNGLLGTFDVTPSLRVGLTVNATNPVAMTGSLPVGGVFPPFERFYIQPYQAVNTGPNHYPDDTFHMYLLAPSVVWRAGEVELKAELQGYQVDTDTTNAFDWFIYGFNARAAVKVKTLGGKLQWFANGAFDRNDVVDPATRRLLPDKYVSFCLSSGVDFNYSGSNGVGAQYARIQFRTGGGTITTLQYANLGTTYWLTPQVSLGARLAFALRHELNSGVPDIGDLALFATARALVF